MNTKTGTIVQLFPKPKYSSYRTYLNSLNVEVEQERSGTTNTDIPQPEGYILNIDVEEPKCEACKLYLSKCYCLGGDAS
jgi:hypothetical protein